MTHEHRGAQRYDGHDQIQIAVAIYVPVKGEFLSDGPRLIASRRRSAIRACDS